jgi:predicted ArsR family transcriptional regulator
MKQCTASKISTSRSSLAPVKSFRTKTRSKRDRLIQLLSNPKGARVLSLCKSLDWQKHTVRAAVSGLRTAGYLIETYASSKDGVTVYKITGKPVPEASV